MAEEDREPCAYHTAETEIDIPLEIKSAIGSCSSPSGGGAQNESPITSTGVIASSSSSTPSTPSRACRWTGSFLGGAGFLGASFCYFPPYTNSAMVAGATLFAIGSLGMCIGDTMELYLARDACCDRAVAPPATDMTTPADVEDRSAAGLLFPVANAVCGFAGSCCYLAGSIALYPPVFSAVEWLSDFFFILASVFIAFSGLWKIARLSADRRRYFEQGEEPCRDGTMSPVNSPVIAAWQFRASHLFSSPKQAMLTCTELGTIVGALFYLAASVYVRATAVFDLTAVWLWVAAGVGFMSSNVFLTVGECFTSDV